VAEEPIVAALPADHALARLSTLSLRALRHEQLVLVARARGPGYYDQILALCHAAGFSPRLVEQPPHFELFDVFTLVSAGLGVTLMPASTQRFHPEGVVFRPLRGGPSSTVVVAWRPPGPSPVLGTFLDMVRRGGIALPPLPRRTTGRLAGRGPRSRRAAR